MEMMNRAVEDAADFRGIMGKIKKEAALARTAMQNGASDQQRHFVVPDRLPGENRAEHRARLKRERRQAKAAI